MRDFIPQGAPLTKEEEAWVHGNRMDAGDQRVTQDFVPQKPRKKGLSREEKSALAEKKAFESQERDRLEDVKAAQDVLKKLGVSEAIDHIESLPEVRKPVFVEAEASGQARVTILKKFSIYLPKE